MIRALILVSCLATFVLPAQVPAQNPDAPERAALEARRVDFEGALATAEADLVPRLVDLAKWCQANRLYLERHRLWTTVVAIDPDHAEGRRGLRYFQNRDGRWVQSKGYRTPKNRSDAKFAEYLDRREAAVGPFRIEIFGRLAKDRNALRPEVRTRILRNLLELDPDDTELRNLLGEVRFEDRWILIETRNALRTREDLARLARASVDDAPEPGEANLSKEERDSSLEWSGRRNTPRVRVVSTTGDAEATATARMSHAVGDYFEHVFRWSQPHRPGFTIYLLSHYGEREQLIQTFPDMDEDVADLLRKAGGGWLDSDRLLAEWDGNPSRRMDGATRQTLGTLLMDSFGIDGDQGWAWEGMGLYLVHHLVGTRLTYFIKRDQYQQRTQSTLWARLQDPTLDWLAEGLALHERGEATPLEFLLGRNVNLMRDEDLLASYVLAAYLLEGRPREAPALLKRIGEGEHPIVAFEEELGQSLPEIESRLARWLREIR